MYVWSIFTIRTKPWAFTWMFDANTPIVKPCVKTVHIILPNSQEQYNIGKSVVLAIFSCGASCMAVLFACCTGTNYGMMLET